MSIWHALNPLKSEHVLSVASSVNNMAGEFSTRPNIIKQSVIASSIQEIPTTQAINNSLVTGPYTRFRKFQSWAERSEFTDTMGFVSGSLYRPGALDESAVIPFLPVDAGYTADVDKYSTGYADYTYWALQHLYQYHPELLNTDLTIGYVESTNTITINYVDGSIETLEPSGYDYTSQYLYIRYTQNKYNVSYPPIVDPVVVLPSGSFFPSTPDMTITSDVDTTVPYTLNEVTTVVTTPIGGGTPTTVTTTTTSNASRTRNDTTWVEETYLSSYLNVGGSYFRVDTRVCTTGYEIVQAVTTNTVTTPTDVIVTTVTTDTLELVRYYQDTAVITGIETWSPVRYFIYKQFSGNPTLDNLFPVPEVVGSFYPVIPARIDNSFIDEGSALYDLCSKAYKKALGSEYSELISKMGESGSLGNIDYAYIVFGVSLNTPDPLGKEYLYNFFYMFKDSDATNLNAYNKFVSDWDAAYKSWVAYKQWYDSDEDTNAPATIPYPAYTQQSINISSNSSVCPMAYNMNIKWNYIREFTGTGSEHELGEVWLTCIDDNSFIEVYIANTGGDSYWSSAVEETTLLRIYKQTSSTTWSCIEVSGLVHTNAVYQGKTVVTTAKEAIEWADGESGFIIPLHTEIFKSLKAKDRNQMSTGCCYMVFNVYQWDKVRFYAQTWFLPVMLIIAVVAIILCQPEVAVAVGTAMGFEGTAALVAGSIVIATGSMIISSIIMKLSIQAFGEEVGRVVGTIASIAVGYYAGGATGLTTLNAVNVINASIALMNTYSAYLSGKIGKINQESMDVIDQMKEQLDKINKLTLQNLGVGNSVDDMIFLSKSTTQRLQEPREVFLNRTLLCGSDVADLTHMMVHEFAELTARPTLNI